MAWPGVLPLRFVLHDWSVADIASGITSGIA
jgi:hypothetical protein